VFKLYKDKLSKMYDQNRPMNFHCLILYLNNMHGRTVARALQTQFFYNSLQYVGVSENTSNGNLTNVPQRLQAIYNRKYTLLILVYE
jgi:hypothetical protein